MYFYKRNAVNIVNMHVYGISFIYFFSCCIAIMRLFLVVPYLFYKLILNVFLPALIM